MKLLFIQGGSRVRTCYNGNCYVDGNFNNKIWSRYKRYCSNLTVILRKMDCVFDEREVKNKLNYIDKELIDLKLVDDIYSPKIRFFDLRKKQIIKRTIEEEIKKNDKIIIRSLGNFYTNTALKYCKKYKKSYLIEVTGFAFESLWYHSFLGKIMSVYREFFVKHGLKNAPFAVYVTERELQKRYPSNGEVLGCSDVELFEMDNVLEQKEEVIEKDVEKNRFTLGTAAFLDVKFKGQKNVIKALDYLNKKGINNIYYEMIGTGSGKKLKKLISKYGLNERVKIVGALNHEDVMKWMLKLDVYVHPSYSEGLCRSIIEAMGLATPIICSKVGGNVELISKKYIYKRKDWKSLALLIERILNDDELLQQSNENFINSKKFNKELLKNKRDEFYIKFISK